MARYGFTALNLAVLLALFEIGSCLHCYQCNSETDPACGDPFKSTKHQVDCMTQDSINYNTLYLRSVLPGEVFGSVVGAPRYCHKIVMRSCLHCYQCNSETDPACGDPFKSTKHQVDCMTQDSINYNTLYLRSVLPGEVFGSVVGAPRYCHKIVMQTGTVVRTCLDANPADINHTCRSLENSSKLANIDPTKKIKHCSVCDKDNCNAATSLSFSLPLATLALIASYLFCKQ